LTATTSVGIPCGHMIAVEYWKEEGLDRVVLARETGAMEMREMKEKVDIEIEAFIHGAMCILQLCN
jgi:collagenase-like PrtC family protease